MTCPHCNARNSPAAFACHNCEADLREEHEPEHAPSTWSAQARRLRVPAASALAIYLALHGGSALGDWYVRQLPVAAAPTAMPGPTATPSPTAIPAAASIEEKRILDPIERARLEMRYAQWKRAHARPVGEMMALYSPEARVNFAGPRYNVESLRQLAAQVRKQHTFTSVQDTAPPRISEKIVTLYNGRRMPIFFPPKEGQALVPVARTRVTIHASHSYNHSSKSQPPFVSARILVWEKQKGEWLIVEDSLS